MSVKKTSYPSTCASEIDEHLKSCDYMKILINDVVIIFDEVIDTPETVLIHSINKKKSKYEIDYSISYIILLVTIFFLLFIIVII